MLNGKDNYSYVIVQTEIGFKDLFGAEELNEARKNYRSKSKQKLGLGYIMYRNLQTR